MLVPTEPTAPIGSFVPLCSQKLLNRASIFPRKAFRCFSHSIQKTKVLPKGSANVFTNGDGRNRTAVHKVELKCRYKT